MIPAGISIMAIIFFITKLPALKQFNIFNFMIGAGYLSDRGFLFNQNINVAGILPFPVKGVHFVAQSWPVC